MRCMKIYLDESGNLSKRNGKYFIVGSFTINDPKRIINAFKKWRKSKFPRKLQSQPEVKFNNSSLDDTLRLKTLEQLVKQDIRIFYTYLAVKNVPEEYLKKGVIHKTGLLYTEIVGATLDLYLPNTQNELRVFRDSRSLRGVSVSQFNESLKLRIVPQLSRKTVFEIQTSDSTTSPEIQVADWICGALARYYEDKLLGAEFYKVLKSYVVGEKELFGDYWNKKWKR